ncbi:uncharacterized protein MELLADRAFT_89794 [Melampsora larici-populina 98AG31]|uniref:Uncharacterized protein n=1 Tax=Melampsora larici-populina (strain 98AG31 / pathotype 3-4-7) TaxID=747676 RepID=F4SEB7_MELLP|nr:uncharacterized protein MELLADRAFT_89794 [Melampsora larici-populina 98AG31]EGF97007.1 hypothetical protein MELLADRAFT_89794 [Melampsora larici-populina 98AG31]
MDPSKSSPARPSDVSEKLSSVTGDLPPVILNKAISSKSNQELASYIGLKFLKKYNQDA